jgi:poly(A) polymerase
MIRKFIKRLLGRPQEAAPQPPAIPLGVRVEVPASDHGIDPDLLDANAVRVVRTLRDAGHQAYVVGGAVRDLLVGLRPKDFDVATDATPEQVKALFRRAFVIGRRFRLVHVVFGRGREHEVIEVSTFRAYLDAAAADQVPGNEKTSKGEIADKAHVVDASGRVLRDNVWGPQIEDAARRDFTVNAMYYEPMSQTVVDYHEGLQDARRRVLRMIGDPATRYREDPVRIVRVVRFAAKLGFALDPGTQAPIRQMVPLLANVPASRLFDEMIKLLQTGHALRSLDELRAQGLDRGVFPVLDAVWWPETPHPQREPFVRAALEDTDRRVADGRAVAPSFMLACLLWHEVLTRWQALRESGEPAFPALQQAIDAVFDARVGDISGRGRLAADMREIWQMQPRFERRTAASAQSLINQPRFRAGYDFLRLRADVGEVDSDLADWWEDYHLGSDEDREALVDAARPGSGHRRPGSAGRPEARRADSQQDSPPPDAGGPEADAAPRRRRRRRRKAGAGPAVGTGGQGGTEDGPR